MSAAHRSTFVYVRFIRTTPGRLWEALIDPEFIRQYWFGMSVECGWKKGSPWKLVKPDGSAADTGEILEVDPPRRMVIEWGNEWKPELKAEGTSRCTIEFEPMGSAVKLTITHEIDRPESKLITAVSGGWPKVISNLKSLLETGSEPTKFWLSNLPANTSLKELVRLAKLRWRVERDYQELKKEIGRPFRGAQLARLPPPRHTMRGRARVPCAQPSVLDDNQTSPPRCLG
jgi:uncharacterized protein YndB with AHSA1/START domain